MKTLGLILIDHAHGRFGHAATLNQTLGDRTVLEHTLDRAQRIDGVDEWVLLDITTVQPPSGEAPHVNAEPEQPQRNAASGAPDLHPVLRQFGDTFTRLTAKSRPRDRWMYDLINAGRKWSLTAWRGGIGGMSIYDELLPAYPLLQALEARAADAAVVLRGDWCLVDSDLASEQLDLFKTAPEALKMIFTQAPPGLSPLVIGKATLVELDEHQATVANILCYNPKKPVIDPMGKDVNVPIPASVRDQYRRFIHDTPRAIDHLRAISEYLGPALASADATQITDASRAIETDRPDAQLDRLPQQFTIELSPRRQATGPIVPQSQIDLGRSDMTRDTLDAALSELGRSQDAAVLFGGLGDALLSEHVDYAVHRARELGVMGVGIETDLLCDEAMVERLAALPVDVVSVRINADSAGVYHEQMGIEDGYRRVLDNIQTLYKLRARNRERFATITEAEANFRGNFRGFRGWIVPRFVKVTGNLSDLETFFERWMTICGWAVVDRAWTGMGLIEDQSPVPMDPPRRPGKPNVQKTRLTVLADGTVTLCGQDWLGRVGLGNVNDARLSDLWRSSPAIADQVMERPEADRPICRRCQDWLAAQDRKPVGV